ncbi:MAG: glycosyltransferase family 9 protein [Methylococcales bacterium]
MEKRITINPPPKRILIIAMRFLGDVLLATPLIHSLRLAYSEAQVDVLIYQNTVAMLEGNEDIDQIITTPQHPDAQDNIKLFKKIFRSYDLAVVTQTGDRPLIYGIFAAPIRIGFTPKREQKRWWKRYLLQGWTEFDTHNTHTVIELLKLSTLINIKPFFSLIPPNTQEKLLPSKKYKLPNLYAILHIHPQWQYKRWTAQGWIEIANYLAKLSITPVLSGSSAQEEQEYIAEIKKSLPKSTIDLSGQLSLAELANLITYSQLFIGPDTGITHLAAATGTSTIAIFGPSNPVKWAPWPIDYTCDINPFTKKGTQYINNVYLIQGKGDCVPCYLEGCNRHRGSYSSCLDNLSAQEVKIAIAQILNNT